PFLERLYDLRLFPGYALAVTPEPSPGYPGDERIATTEAGTSDQRHFRIYHKQCDYHCRQEQERAHKGHKGQQNPQKCAADLAGEPANDLAAAPTDMHRVGLIKRMPVYFEA